jgi:hypothetical protein
MPLYIHTLDKVLGTQRRQTEIRVERQGTIYTKMVRAIPEPYTAGRLHAAWAVLTGRAYALAWPKAGDLENALSN